MKISEISEGDVLFFGAQEVTVTKAEKGWVETVNADGLANKVRAKNLTKEQVVQEEIPPADSSEDTQDSDEEAKEKLNMSGQLRKYRVEKGYVSRKCYSGKKSADNGDEVADFLNGFTPLQVAQIAQKAINTAAQSDDECPDLLEKYGHLNPGQIRMNSGNRIRAAMKRGDVTLSDVKAAAQTVGGKVEHTEKAEEAEEEAAA